MRKLLAALPLLSLAACGGAGLETVGSTPVGTPTSGSQSGSTHSFVNPTTVKTYSAIGGVQSYRYTTNENNNSGQYNQLYAGNASTARNSAISVTYDPRDAIFELTIADTKAGVDQKIRFQDPAHRTDFGGAVAPQGGVPDQTANGVRYLQVGGGTGISTYDPAQSTTFPIGEEDSSVNRSTFFYQIPGTRTRYVTFAGYVRNQTSVAKVTPPSGPEYLEQNHVLERAAFVFGERTNNSAVPTSGSATYTGAMQASMVYNPDLDTLGYVNAPTYFQWINGSASTTVDFASRNVSIALTGTIDAPLYDVYTSRNTGAPAGSQFTASGSGQIDLVNAGGFLGQFTNATVNGTALTIAGSSLDGAFFGPAAEEVGGGFRIVGGTPDERIDIIGSYTGAR